MAARRFAHRGLLPSLRGAVPHPLKEASTGADHPLWRPTPSASSTYRSTTAARPACPSRAWPTRVEMRSFGRPAVCPKGHAGDGPSKCRILTKRPKQNTQHDPPLAARWRPGAGGQIGLGVLCKRSKETAAETNNYGGIKFNYRQQWLWQTDVSRLRS